MKELPANENLSGTEQPSVNDQNVVGFVELLDQVRGFLSTDGIVLPAEPLEYTQDFLQLSAERQESIARSLQSIWQSLCPESQAELQGSEELPLPLQKEISSLRMFLRKNGLGLRDNSFEQLIDNGDIVEIYDANGVQIFRNFNYFRYCPYSLSEMQFKSWDELFSRPTSVTNELLSLMPSLFQKGATTFAYKIPEYLVSARLRENAKGMLYKMKYASPVINRATRQTVAFVTTGTVRFVPDAKIGLQLDFI